MNQYYVVMAVAPNFWQSPGSLRDMWVSTVGGALTGTQSTAAAVNDFSITSPISSTLYAPGQSAVGSNAFVPSTPIAMDVTPSGGGASS